MNLPHTLGGVLKKTRGVPCGGEPILLGRLPINSRQEGSSLQQRLTYMEGAVDTEIAIRQPSRSRLLWEKAKSIHTLLMKGRMFVCSSPGCLMASGEMVSAM